MVGGGPAGAGLAYVLADRGARVTLLERQRDFVRMLAARSRERTGLRGALSRNLLQGIEETNERVPYGTLCLIALGLDCNPVELLDEGALLD